MLVISCFSFFNITGLLADHKLLKYMHIHLGWINTAVLTKWCPLCTGFTALMLYVIAHLRLMHLICPPFPPPVKKNCITFVFHFSWVLQPSLKRTILKTCLWKIRCIMGDVQVAFSRNKKGRLKYAAGKKNGDNWEFVFVYNKSEYLFTTNIPV